MIIFVNADGGRFRRRMQRFDGCAHLFRVETPGQGNLNDGYSYELLESCKKGDRKAQKSLYDLLAPKMMALCMRYAGSRELAEDLLQDGFVTLFSKMGNFKNEGSFEGWARRVFVTTCLMYLRKNDVLRMSEDISEARKLSSSEPGQMEEISYRELMSLVMELPPGFRAVFNMYAVEGYSHKDISEQLGISETTSRTQFSRARTWLRKRLEEKNNGR